MPADPKAAVSTPATPTPSSPSTSPSSAAPSAMPSPANTVGAADAKAMAERDKALGLVLNQIERNFGKGSIMRLGDASRMRVETISTGAL
ncbi:MAG: hypothetical protein ACKOCI_11400, partial [Cyanobium sp.]